MIGFWFISLYLWFPRWPHCCCQTGTGNNLHSEAAIDEQNGTVTYLDLFHMTRPYCIFEIKIVHSPSGCSYVGILVVTLFYLNLKEQRTVTKRPGQKKNQTFTVIWDPMQLKLYARRWRSRLTKWYICNFYTTDTQTYLLWASVNGLIKRLNIKKIIWLKKSIWIHPPFSVLYWALEAVKEIKMLQL